MTTDINKEARRVARCLRRYASGGMTANEFHFYVGATRYDGWDAEASGDKVHVLTTWDGWLDVDPSTVFTTPSGRRLAQPAPNGGKKSNLTPMSTPEMPAAPRLTKEEFKVLLFCVAHTSHLASYEWSGCGHHAATYEAMKAKLRRAEHGGALHFPAKD